MKTYYIRLKSLSNHACEIQELKSVDAMAAVRSGKRAATHWGTSNGSEAVRWWVEDFSGRTIGQGATWTKSARKVVHS
jgi:hypothetical protein